MSGYGFVDTPMPNYEGMHLAVFYGPAEIRDHYGMYDNDHVHSILEKVTDTELAEAAASVLYEEDIWEKFADSADQILALAKELHAKNNPKSNEWESAWS